MTAAIVLLASAIVLAIWSLRPEPRHRTNPDVLKHYAVVGTADDEARHPGQGALPGLRHR
jgi:hypothetical protein